MKKKPIVIIGGVAGLCLIVYFGFVIFFSHHYLFNTTIGAVKCGGKTADYVISQNESIASDYLLSVKDREGKLFAIAGSDIDYSYVVKGEEEALLKGQNAFGWIASIFKKTQYDLPASISYDSAKAQSAVESLEIFDESYITKPTSATINITEDSYELVPEDIGNEPITDQVLAEITAALDDEKESVTLSDACYTEPEVTQDDSRITEATATLDKYFAAGITYTIGDATESLTAEDIAPMISIGEDYSVNIDEDALLKFVQGLCSTYNTYADTRDFVTSKGDTVKIGGGDYGWVISKTQEMEEIKKDLEGGTQVTREPIWEQTAKEYGTEDIGDTYIEIDYTSQHLWYYEEGQLKAETDIVSGNLSSSNGSVDGVFYIKYKEKDATLVGEDYSSAVTYFMPFAYNIGIHDASWRSSFGGDIYKTSGSHGCINVPFDAAKTLFSMVETGTPVVAYYREKVELTNNAAQQSNAYSFVKKEDDAQ